MTTKRDLNKWLCKHFDNDNKGYVELGDIAYQMLRAVAGGVVLSMIVFWIGGVVRLSDSPIEDIFTWEEAILNFTAFFTGLLYLIGLIIIVAIIVYLKINRSN